MSDPFAELQNDVQDTMSVDGNDEQLDMNTSTALNPSETELGLSDNEEVFNDSVPTLRQYSSESEPDDENDDFGSDLVTGEDVVCDRYFISILYFSQFVFLICSFFQKEIMI